MYSEDALAIFAVLGVFMLIIAVVSIAVYVLGSLGLMKVAEREGVENAWLAFIPIANLYILGQATQDRVNIDNLPMWLVGASIATFFSGMIPVIGFIIPLAYYIFLIYVLHKLFEKYTDKALIFTIIGIFTGLQYLFLFFIRNNEKLV